eukprot:3845922-Pyramimonas_sp.AAC.1
MAEAKFCDGYWNTAEIAFWSSPKPVTGDGGPTQHCTMDTGQVVMSEVRICHRSPAAYHTHGS